MDSDPTGWRPGWSGEWLRVVLAYYCGSSASRMTAASLPPNVDVNHLHPGGPFAGRVLAGYRRIKVQLLRGT